MSDNLPPKYVAVAIRRGTGALCGTCVNLDKNRAILDALSVIRSSHGTIDVFVGRLTERVEEKKGFALHLLGEPLVRREHDEF